MTKKKLVNWTPSMDVGTNDFVQLENYFIESISESTKLGITHYNYGLLPMKSKNDEAGITIGQHPSDHVEVRLTQCDAITPSGIRIALSTDKPLTKSYDPAAEKADSEGNQATHWDIILSVDPFKRIATGKLNPDEDPPRHPDAESWYALHIVKGGEVNTAEAGGHHLIIGRIRQSAGKVEVDTDYIPPCTNMQGHAALKNYFNSFGDKMLLIERMSKSIIAKVHHRANKSDLAMNIKSLSEEMLRYIAANYFNYRNRAMFESPINTVNCLASLAHVCYVHIYFLDGPQREELLKYFYEWSDIAPGAFEEMLASTLEMQYDHNNLRAMMIRIDGFITVLTELWVRMSGLEYIGQHKENIIVSERKQQAEQQINKSGWTTME